jgi:GMP synthase-like glutamine amidotransferase
MQWLGHKLGGKVSPGKVKEYGRARMEIVNGGGRLLNFPVLSNASFIEFKNIYIFFPSWK